MPEYEITLKIGKEEKTYTVEAPRGAFDGQLKNAAIEVAKAQDNELVEKYKNEIHMSFYKRV